jgi:hypothetical protein
VLCEHSSRCLSGGCHTITRSLSHWVCMCLSMTSVCFLMSCHARVGLDTGNVKTVFRRVEKQTRYAGNSAELLYALQQMLLVPMVRPWCVIVSNEMRGFAANAAQYILLCSSFCLFLTDQSLPYRTGLSARHSGPPFLAPWRQSWLSRRQPQRRRQQRRICWAAKSFGCVCSMYVWKGKRPDFSPSLIGFDGEEGGINHSPRVAGAV